MSLPVSGGWISGNGLRLGDGWLGWVMVGLMGALRLQGGRGDCWQGQRNKLCCVAYTRRVALISALISSAVRTLESHSKSVYAMFFAQPQASAVLCNDSDSQAGRREGYPDDYSKSPIY